MFVFSCGWFLGLWSVFGWLGCYGFAGFVVGTWWVLFCFIILGSLVPVGFCWAEGSGGVVVIVCF